ncbi:MAG TPA: MucB/RseB C-terminal domain-containing protein [Steroidobacteraceae bacterium]|jgi:sigma-E factor negative regulatory protein RseB
MPTKRVSERLTWLAFALAAAASAIAQEPRQWLERMNQALTSRNYDGVFAHWQDGRVEMLRIIHRNVNGQVTERLASLDGSGREFIRNGAELSCYLPDKRTVLVSHSASSASLLTSIPAIDNKSAAFYDIEEVMRTRVNRRDTRVIAVTPRDEFRYGYRLWIDESTAMPLKTQLCDAHGRVIEQVVFANLELANRIPDSAFRPDVATDGYQWVRNDPTSAVSAGLPNLSALWSALRLPPGFRMTVRSAQLLPGAHDPVAHLVFTDGLASVSVFVESGFAAPADQQTVAGVASVGSASAFTTVIDGHKVTAVGEVPPNTVRFIATSVTKSEPAVAVGSPGH